ncbi:MAG: hypothetical protein WA789_09880 [Candidatus Acidiferrum sp.]
MPDYAVIPADLKKDRQVIIDLWRQNLADTGHLDEKYDWQFLNNPFGPGQIWILQADGRPIGTTSLGMRPLQLGRTVTMAGVACDLAVNKKHRFLQPALMLQRALLSTSHAGVRIVYGVPNPPGASVLKHVGYSEFCSVHRYAKLLRVSHYLQRSRKFGAIVPFIGRMADHGFAALQSFSRGRENGRVAKVLSCFDERFDELWSRMEAAHPTLTVRDRRFLTWRYHDCPLRQYKTLGLLTEDESRLLGYLIYYVEDRSAVCADVFVLSGAEDLSCLLSSWAAAAWRNGLASLSLSCSDGALPASLLRLGFTRRSATPTIGLDRSSRREQCKTLFTHEQHSAAEHALAGSWYYTEGDSPY